MSECPRGEIRDRLPEYVHATLGAVERAAIDAHLATCAACPDEVALLRAMREAMTRRTPAVDLARIAAAAIAAPRIATTRALPRLVWYAAAAAVLLAVGALGYFAGRVPTAGNSPSNSPVAVTPPTVTPALTSWPAPAPVPTAAVPHQVAVAPSPAPAPMVAPAARGLSFGGGVEDLSAAQVSSLMKELDGIAPALDDEPARELDLEGAS